MTTPHHDRERTGDEHIDDPYERRRRAVRRTRLLTATLGAAALVGTGALTAHLTAQQSSAGQTTAAQNGTATGTTASGSISQPQQPPTSAGSGSVHAASGGS